VRETVAIFAGTFDPVTLGHLDLIRRGALLFDRLVVCVARGGRATRFTAEERAALLNAAVEEELETGADTGASPIQVEIFDGLVVERARRHGARVLLRGIRGNQDWEGELQMAFANRGLAGEIDTVFLPPSPGMTQISASLVREVAALGGDVSAWVPAAVLRALSQSG
jgi:pantetheine-phosphate adenylyltransferase